MPNENLKHLNYWKSLRNDINLVTFGMNKSADFYPIEIKYNLNGTKFRIQSKKYNKDVTIETPLSGEHNVKNILASYAVSNILNNPDEIFITKLKNNYYSHINNILLEATLEIPESKWFQTGGKEGIHSEHLGYLLSDLQYMQRTYPNMEW